MSITNEAKNWETRGITYQIKPIKTIPWWIVYPVLLIIGIILLSTIYRGYIKSDSKETYATGQELSVNITHDGQPEENLGAGIDNTDGDVSNLLENNVQNVNSMDESNGKVRYVTQEFNVRTGPGTQYTRLYTVSINEEIEVLENTWR